MAIPPKAFFFEQTMDPSDLIEYEVECDGVDGMLETGEAIASFTLTLLPESVALGLTIVDEIRDGQDYSLDAVNGVAVRVWFEIDETLRDNAAFLGVGASLPMELTIITDSTPPRRRQRTLVVGVVQS